jgi:hypothetical protein
MFEDDDIAPATEPLGVLQLPPIHPPTAVGAATAPRPGRYPTGLTRVRRIALALLAVLLWGGAGALVGSLGTRATAAGALAIAGTHVALRAISASNTPLRLLVAAGKRAGITNTARPGEDAA